MSFNSLGLSDALLKASNQQKVHTFSNTAKAIPPILEGKDVLASCKQEQEKQQDSPTHYRHYRKENT
jgi:hypothetical protein